MTLERRFATRLRHALVTWLRPRGKLAFLKSLPPGARVLDVGCGNNSPRDAKVLRPDLVYHGIDVGDYNQRDSVQYADAYTVVAPESFAEAVAANQGMMDAVVSSHNLEHCDDPAGVLRGMAAALRPDGLLYLAFPCEESLHFPRRRGTLNFRDDRTHNEVPTWQWVLDSLAAAGLAVEFRRKRYRPPMLAAIGLLFEPVGWATGRTDPVGATWALYGFESVIWARRTVPPQGPTPRTT
jgi:SAM-dependent methyltransferase